MAEGISTFPQTFPPHSQDLHELSAPKGPTSPFISHLRVNDLGLTPSPGSQQEQKRSATHVSCHDDEYGWSDGGAAVTDQHSAISLEKQARDLHTETDCEPYDPLFDEDIPFQDLESAFSSQKRAHDEAFPESLGLEGPPEKRQAQDMSNSANTPPDETPSLSPNSTYRTDKAETALNTPAGIEDFQTPNSLFESLDLLSQGPGFPLSFEGDQFSADFPSTGLDDLQLRLDHDTSNASEQTLKPTNVAQPEKTLPLASDETNHRFSLDAQDVVANSSREILQRVDSIPQYTSPYPEYGGPLGYIPSTPSLHAKCIEVTEEQMNNRMKRLRHKNQQLTSERNKYKDFWAYFSIADAETGKTKQDVIQEENSMLRRVSSRHQTRAEEYKKEAECWKGSLNEVSRLYNNLLYEINVLRRIPEVVPPPNGYKPPSNLHVAGQHQPSTVPAHPQQPVVPGRPVRYQQPAATNIQNPQPGHASQHPSRTLTSQRQWPPGSSCSSRSTPVPAPAPAPTVADGSGLCTITIDLTEDDNDTAPQPQQPSASKTNGTEVLKSLRKKRYHWLEGNSTSPLATSETCSSTAPQTEATVHPQAVHGDDNDNDDLARMMEEELARSA